MGEGVQLFDSAGSLLVDTSTFLVKTGILDIGTVTSNGSINIAAIQALGGVVIPVVDAGTYAVAPNVSISGSTLSWNARSSLAGINARIRVEIQ